MNCLNSYINKCHLILYILMPTVSPCTRRPARKVLVCGSEDGLEASRAPGTARGTGLPPVNDCNHEGLRSGSGVA